MKKGLLKPLVYSLLVWTCIAPGIAGDEKHPALLDPTKATEQAPEEFSVLFETTKGNFTVKVYRQWSPIGADRFYNLVKIGYFTEIAVYRAIDQFMVQFGFSGDPQINQIWSSHRIQDDPIKESNTPGRITFAKTGRPNSRSTQFFINTVNNSNLDGMGFTPFGEVQGDGLEIVKQLYTGYGEGAPRGRGPNQGRIKMEGNSYLKKSFPELDYIKKVSIVDKAD